MINLTHNEILSNLIAAIPAIFANQPAASMEFPTRLLAWYSVAKRDLPWRRTKDPYLVWLSEIIMQQTRVEQGTPYYDRFVAAYPAVQLLAAAGEQEILKLWQGLGYYSRARNLHATARKIVEDYDGLFPGTYNGIRKLKGIGDYTAAAIASICFGLPYPVVDGNVLRFVARLHGIEESIDHPAVKKRILAIVTKNIEHANPGDFNQAMMEFGALVCVPANPGCSGCIFQGDCIACHKNVVDSIPRRNVKPAIRHRYLNYLVLTVSIHGEEFIYMNRRTGSDIWKNLYDFPVMEFAANDEGNRSPEQIFGSMLASNSPSFLKVSGQYQHLLTHQKLHAWFYRFHSDIMIELPFYLVPLNDIHKYPVPKLIDRYLLDEDGMREDP